MPTLASPSLPSHFRPRWRKKRSSSILLQPKELTKVQPQVQEMAAVNLAAARAWVWEWAWEPV